MSEQVRTLAETAPGSSLHFGVAPRVVTLSQPRSAEAEGYRALRTHVMARHVEDGRRALSICAVTPDVGCTAVAANLAVTLAQVGLKTLLIDANMREPGVQELFRPSHPTPGLAECLVADRVHYPDFVHEDVIPNLSLMLAGTPPPNPQELLATDRFEDFMSVCLRDYEMTILDTPPASSCSDVNRISSVVGYSLVVARRDRTLFNDVRTLIEQLEGDRAIVVGSVMTEY